MNIHTVDAPRERRAAQRRGDDSESFFRTLFEHAPVACVLAETSGHIRQVNAAFTAIFGYTATEAKGLTVESITHPDDLPQTRETMRVITSGQRAATRYEKRYRHKDGHTLWAIVTVSAIRVGDRDMALGQILDVTEQHRTLDKLKQAHVALAANENRFRALIENIADVIVVLAPDGIIRFISAAISAITGYAPAEVIGRPLQEFVHPDDLPQALQRIQDLMRDPVSARRSVYRLRHRDGGWRHVEVVSRNQLTDPAIGGIVTVIRDVSERRQSEASQRITKDILDAIPVRVFWKDRNLVYLGCNTAFAQDAGFAGPQDIVGKDDTQMGWREQADRYRADDRKVIDSGVSKLFIEEPQTTPDGKTITLLTSKIPLRDAAGKIEGVLGTYMDISKHKQAEHRLSLFRTLIDRASDAIEVLDPVTLRFLDVNDEACRDLGYRRDELLNMTVYDIDPAVRKDQVRALDQTLDKGEIAVLETVHRRKDGTEFPVEVSIRRVQLDRRYQIATVRNISERRRIENALKRVNRALQTLSAGNEALVRATDESALLKEMVRVLSTVGGYPIASIGYRMDDPARSVEFRAATGFDPDSLQPKVSWGDNEQGHTAAGRAIRLGTVQLIRDVTVDQGLAPWRASPVLDGIRAVLAIPLKLPGSVATFGALALAGGTDAFNAEEVKLMEELANDLSYGIANLRMAAEHRSAGESLRRSLEGTIAAIGATMEARDPYTAGHQHRVATLAEAIASEMGLPAARVAGVRFGSLIHDVGKIQLPSEILAKPSRLTRLEYEMIKTHPRAGYDIVKDIEFPWPIAQMVLQHHERLDGSGYPQGLKGENILLEARILAVADVVEAMSSHRPYRPSRGIEAALKEIEDKKGTHFEPAAVDACLKLFREEFYTLESH